MKKILTLLLFINLNCYMLFWNEEVMNMDHCDQRCEYGLKIFSQNSRGEVVCQCNEKSIEFECIKRQTEIK